MWAGSFRPSSRRRFSSACGVAACPRIELATSPGRTSVPAKISTEAAKSRRMPSAIRWAISLITGCPPNGRLRSGLVEPDAGRRPQVGCFMVGIPHPALDLFAASVEEVIEHGQDQAALIPDLESSFAIELRAAFFVQLSSSFQNELVEVLIEEARVVPVGAADIGGGIHGILRRPPTPVGGAEGLGIPDLRPVAIPRLALDLDLDSRRRSLLLIELCGIDRARKGHLRCAQEDWALMPGALIVEARLVGIVEALLNAFGVKGIGRRDGEVVADRGM